MNTPHLKPGVIWLTKQGLYFYVEGQNAALAFPFQPDAINFFDIVDEIKFDLQLEAFLKQNNLNNINYYLIIGPDALAEKEFVKGDDKAINQFIELFPYEEVFSKKVIKEKSILVACFNASFYYLIKTVIEKHLSVIKSVFPYFTFSVNKFDIPAAQLIMKKADGLRFESLIADEDRNQTEELSEIPAKSDKNEEKSTLPILLPVFLILVAVLVIVVFLSQKNTNNIPKTNITPSPTSVIIPTPTGFRQLSPSINQPEATPSGLQNP